MNISATTGAGANFASSAPKKQGLTEAEHAKVKKACQDLEAHFLTQIMKESRPKDATMGGGFAADTFADMFSQELGKNMASNGGIGLTDKLVAQFERQSLNIRTPNADTE